ncbi:MAG TPA: shikimate dehydrogenase [Isosphaeraceae bacterium]|jgi:3-dehydroquinate dehydratase/shikimate dehydrogenase|nr:shikimate dehydrogenase [Isosphaeraceae bacterium]
MICVTIGRGRHKSLLAEWKAAAEEGAQLVELRIDCLRSTPNIKRIMSERYTPVVFTVRRGVDGGLWRLDEEKRLLLIREAIAAGVDYVDLEADIANKIPRFGKTKRIVSYHNFKKTPPDLEEYIHQLEDLDPDVIKFATLADSITEASKIIQAASQAKAPAVGIAMGEVGKFTRYLAGKFGAPFTYAGYNPDRQFAPGMPSFKDLKRDFFYDQIDAQTEVYAVIGDPIQHSLSPAIHNAAYRELGMNKVMLPLLIPDEKLQESLDALEWLDLKGLAVTIPHKEEIIKLLDQEDGAVERTGSCNTVVIENGRWVGYNTDYRAAMDSLEEAMGGRTDSDISPLLNKQVMVLGAGGVARSIAYGLMRRGAGVILCNRSEERAIKLAEEVGCRTVDWAMRAGTLADVLINCTPVGMHPNVDETPIPPAGFKPGMIAFDTVYHPESTMFVKLARDRTCTTITGVDMFVRQAALQFKQFTGQDAPATLMRDVVKRKLGPVAV